MGLSADVRRGPFSVAQKRAENRLIFGIWPRQLALWYLGRNSIASGPGAAIWTLGKPGGSDVGKDEMTATPVPVVYQTRGFKGALKPPSARVSVSQSLDFSAVSASLAVAVDYTFNFDVARTNGIFDVPRSVFIDNSGNPNQLYVNVSQTNANFPVAPFTIGVYPIFAQEGSIIDIYSLGGATKAVAVEFFNTYEIPWSSSAFSPLVPGFNVQVQPPAAKTITNHNTTLNANAATNIIPASAVASRLIMFRNVGNDVAYYNLSAAATGVFAAGDLELMPGPNWTQLPFGQAGAISFFLPNGGSASVAIEAMEIGF